MPLVYLDSVNQQYTPGLSETEPWQDCLRQSEGSMKNFLGFTPPDQQSPQLLRARKSKSRKAALRGIGADGGDI